MIYVVIAVSLDLRRPVEKRIRTFRTWGYYLDKEKAISAIEKNKTDYLENGYYTHALLNSMPEGLAVGPSTQEWWEAAYEDSEDPKITKLDHDPLNKGASGGRRIIVW